MHSPIAEQRKLAFEEAHAHPCIDTGDHDGEEMGKSAREFRALGGALIVSYRRDRRLADNSPLSSQEYCCQRTPRVLWALL